MKKKILFCYFGPRKVHYTPTDIGYVLSSIKIKTNLLDFFDIQIIELSYKIFHNERDFLEDDINFINLQRPDAVFIFTENVLWSKVCAIGRAKKIAREIKLSKPDIFIGIQGYKVKNFDSKKLFEDNFFDCIIGADPESSFIYLERILEKQFVPGVEYKITTYPKEGLINFMDDFKTKTCVSCENLDYIPSPYLNNIFDNYIQTQQIKYNGLFRAFLVSSRGCNFACHYCFRSTKFEKVSVFSVVRFYDELEYLLNNFQVYNFLVLDDAFLYSRERLIEFRDEFDKRLERNKKLENIDIFVMARPETVDESIIETLSHIKVKSIQFGLQTVNPKIQHYMNRKMDVAYFKKIRDWCKKNKIKLYLDIVLGLPNDDREWAKETIRYALLLDPFFLQIKQFFLVPDTLIFLNKEEFNIEVDKEERDFDSPYVLKSTGIDEKYFAELHNYILKQINYNQDIVWKYITKKGSFISKDVLPREVFCPSNIFLDAGYQNYWSLKDKNILNFYNSPLIGSSGFLCLVLNNGEYVFLNETNTYFVWKLKTNVLFKKNKEHSQLSFYENKLLFFDVNNSLYCVDIFLHKILWVSFDGGKEVVSSLYVDNSIVLYLSECGLFNKSIFLICIDMATGVKKWDKKICETKNNIFYYQNSKVFVVFNKNILSGLDVFTGDVIWEHKNINIDDTKNVCITDVNFVFFSNGCLSVINLTDGICVNGIRFDKKYRPYSYKEYVVAISFFGEINCLKSSFDKVIWKIKINKNITSNLLFKDGLVFFGTQDGFFYGFDLENGKIITCFNLSKNSIITINYNDKKQRFFVLDSHGGLVCFGKNQSVYFFKNIQTD